MISDTVIKILRNAKFGLGRIYKEIAEAMVKEEELSTVELSKLRSELRAVRKQICIVEEEME